MEDNFEETMEEQIGNIGNEEEAKPTTLGKMKHKPGSKKNLSDEEEASKEAFLERTRKKHDLAFEGDIMTGWIPIDRNEMGVRSQFYPSDWEFRIKPATVEAIKNWSSIDEENIAVTNNVFNEIMKACISIVTPNGKLPWSKINSWDRFWFILKVREYTFYKGESALKYDEECPECGATVYYDLRSENLVYEFPDDEIVEKYWNSEDRMWYINPKEYDLDEPIQKLFVPTLEKDDAILSWAYAQTQQGKSVSEPFLRFLPWLLQKSSKDPNVLERFIKEAKSVFNSWDAEMFTFMDEVLRNITINPSEKLKQICPNCGEEVQTTVRFQDGIKSIFAIPHKHRKFGSK